MEKDYAALTVETLPDRLSGIPEITERVGSDPAQWQVKEVGDGNLNLVFIVEGPKGLQATDIQATGVEADGEPATSEVLSVTVEDGLPTDDASDDEHIEHGPISHSN